MRFWLWLIAILTCLGIGLLPAVSNHGTLAGQMDGNEMPVYLDVEGGVSLTFDQASRTMAADTFSDNDERTPEGRLIGERQSYGYGDCSDTSLICRDFEEFVLAVPRSRAKLSKWVWQGWKFKVTACLKVSDGNCTRFTVKFKNDDLHREGGFVFSYLEGVEMFYYANMEMRDPRHIYVKRSLIGLLDGARH
jgi:hypothetical protein